MTQFLFPGLWLSIILGVIVASSFPAGMIASQITGIRRGRLRADVAAFGSGVFFGTISFSLVQQATRLGTPLTLIVGFVIGATALSTTNYLFMKMEERTKSEHPTNNERQLPRKGRAGSAKTMIVGSLLDSIPESLYVGVLVALRAAGLYGSVATLFLGNIAVAFEASQIMLERGKLTKRDILVRWLFVFLVLGVATPAGFLLVSPLSDQELSVIMGVAAGALLSLITEELIPGAYSRSRVHIGLSATFGFLVAFALIRIY